MKKLICLLLALVMVVAMVACVGEVKETVETQKANENKVTYEEAVAAYNAGAYAAAIEKLTVLGDYEDAAQLLATIKAEKTGVSVEMTTPEGSTANNVEFVFKDGNLIKETTTYADGTVIKNYYKYNDAGLCTSETLNGLDGGKTVINHFYEDGNKIRSIRTNPDKTKDTYEYTCDENGKIVTHVLTLADGTVEEAVYSYDEATGLLVSVMTPVSSNTFTYNRYGDVASESLTVNGQEVNKITYTYCYNYYVG